MPLIRIGNRVINTEIIRQVFIGPDVEERTVVVELDNKNEKGEFMTIAFKCGAKNPVEILDMFAKANDE